MTNSKHNKDFNFNVIRLVRLPTIFAIALLTKDFDIVCIKKWLTTDIPNNKGVLLSIQVCRKQQHHAYICSALDLSFNGSSVGLRT